MLLCLDLDFERRRLYSYRVVATDAGQPRRSATGDLDVEILDVDDELPQFDVAQYRFEISENLPIGTMVGQVEATDRDSDPAFRHVYYFIDDEGASTYLSVDRLTGEIRTTVVLDREVTSSLTVRVFASPVADRPEVTSSSHCDVIVDVADENDNSPELVFPNDVNHTVFVKPEVVVGKRLVKMNATDADAGVNANLTFFLDIDDRQLGLDVQSTSGSL